jgi:subtilisin family serine protease
MQDKPWQQPGRPFPGEYGDPRDEEQLTTDKAEVTPQVKDLLQRRKDPSFRRELVRTLQQRRNGRDVAQFYQIDQTYPIEPVERAGQEQFETLLAVGELLVRGEDARNPAVQGFAQTYGFSQLPVACLDGRVVRLVNRQVGVGRLEVIARLLQRQGVRASVNHITPLGPIAKGLGGPEPSTGTRPFTANPEQAPGAVTVAVIDTGIAESPRGDRWLAGVPREADNIDRLDAYPPFGFLDFGAGHGTFAAGVLQQVFPQADLRVYRALDSDGVGSEVDVACAMVRAVNDGAQILNLSLGTQTFDDNPPVAIEVALEMLAEYERRHDKEVLVVAAAGNFGVDRKCWPAAFDRTVFPVVAVAGLRADLTPADWSSRGSWVDCSTVAEGVLSTYVEGQESFEIDPHPDSFPRDAWAVWTGTSFAAPQIAGAVARLCQEQQLPPRAALDELLRRGQPIDNYGMAVEILPGTPLEPAP